MAGGLIDIDALAREIYDDVKKKVNDLLRNKIAKEMQEDLVNRAAGEVYGAYSTELYERRGTLMWPETYHVEAGDLEISITPIAPFNRRYGGQNYGNELGGFINFGRGWHGYAMGNGWNLPSGGPLNVPLPRPYLTNTAMEWDQKIQEEISSELGEWGDCVTAKVTLGG